MNENVVGFLVEPIQGEAGVNTPADTFIAQAAELCKERNVLLWPTRCRQVLHVSVRCPPYVVIVLVAIRVSVNRPIQNQTY